MVKVSDDFLADLRASVGSDNVIASGEALETLSKDFYWYSPVLRAELANKRAQVAVRPNNLAELREVVRLCCRERVPLVPRGAGTGNYGQCIPLYGGAVVDFSRLDRIISLENGVAHVEAGARLGVIETAARKVGWELRCLPSTWVKCTIGGFFCGGSGGVGSITWGGINAPGNVKAVTVLTCEDEPRLIRLAEAEALKALHTYGTTGLMVEVEMRLAPKINYDQVIVGSGDWSTLLRWTDEAARRGEWRKRLVSQFEWPIPSYFKPLKTQLPAGYHATFVLIDAAQTEELKASAEKAGIMVGYQKPLLDPPKPPFITDFTWNHTTLWAMQTDSGFTYLQAGFAVNFAEQFEYLRRRFPGEFLFHLEWVAGNSKMDAGAPLRPSVVVGGIPLVKTQSAERLNEMMAYCAEIGVFIANPHTCYLEEGGRHPDIGTKREFKSEVDRFGLLNPGKMKTYPNNPFAGPALV